ncbi:hypothetical protein F9B85_03310 [Heliorestis acidaminivorans]|uniref:Uncharacterized protein n=1 Tax=Heliorestis acidaminivorans TaxID=553427 RepID=A0A6I0F4A8_9FIRM|nr:hypothetical protein F9B85_03310 [Heliorestis acidaminivorans]
MVKVIAEKMYATLRKTLLISKVVATSSHIKELQQGVTVVGTSSSYTRHYRSCYNKELLHRQGQEGVPVIFSLKFDDAHIFFTFS